MSIIIDFITDLGLEIVKERISDIVTLNIVKGRIEEFLKQQLSLNYNITREEEVDFGGLAEYIRCNLLDDVKKRCFGKKEAFSILFKSFPNRLRNLSQLLL